MGLFALLASGCIFELEGLPGDQVGDGGGGAEDCGTEPCDEEDAGPGGNEHDGGPADTDAGTVAADADAGAVDDGFSPVLSSFRIENGAKDRVYFDSSEPITAGTTDGFTISGRTIIGVMVNAGATTGHYFTVNAEFDFWDNNTVRYEGGSDLQDSNGNGLRTFSLTYVDNRIPEPDAPTIRYVSASASGSGNGTSESSPWTASQAESNATAGMTVYFKAGDYGDVILDIDNNGTASSPIKFIGYKSSPGDITSMYYEFGDGARDSAEMPHFKGADRATGYAIDISNRSYLIIRNFQVDNYMRGVDGDYVTHVVVDNLLLHSFGPGDVAHSGHGIGVVLGRVNSAYTCDHNRVQNVTVINPDQNGIQTFGDHNLIRNSRVYSADVSTDWSPTDYYIHFRGRNSIVRDCYVERAVPQLHGGHGIGVKSKSGEPSEYNLIDSCTAVNFEDEAYYFAYEWTAHNVLKNSYGKGDATASDSGIIFKARDGAHHNVFENSVGHRGGVGVSIEETTEGGNDGLPHHNTWRNLVIYDVFDAIRATTSYESGDLTYDNNTVENCTFYDTRNWVRSSASSGCSGCISGSNNMIVNSIVYDVGDYLGYLTTELGWSETYNAYHDNTFSTPSGTGNLSVDPEFVDAANANFHLESSSPVRDAGTDLVDVCYDLDGKERPTLAYSIGAYER